ncbi:uncharacterized protein LOC135949515 [Calliphora vicina]|uniref:uncharacterized protein LOC135949515 n=1 Tax=Calliphora vicina TaxID=7373 RepID=UPI00325A8872
MHRSIFVLFITITFLVYISNGLYIKTATDNQSIKTSSNNNNADAKNKNEWSVFKQKLGLTNQKVELLKSQKDQEGTMELLNRFIQENPKYNTNAEATEEPINTEPSNHFLQVYHNILKQLKLSRSTLKTSLNFELADKPQKNLKRSRRKIAVKMVSDMPTEKIDDLLKMFNEKHGINNQDNDDDDVDGDVDVPEADGDYSDFPMNLPSAMDPDYMYENLYEDEEDLAVPAKSHHNSQYGSLQDLILQASRNQWQREIEETKLRNRNNEHFI